MAGGRKPATGPGVEEVLDPSWAICDPHHHLMARELITYTVDDLLEDLAAGHRVTSTMYMECANAYRTEGPEHLRPVGEVEHVVAQVVPPGVMAGIVAYADLGLGAAVEEVLDAHEDAARGRLKGIRFMTAWDPDHAYPGRRSGMLAEPPIRAGIAALERRGLPLDCWMFAHQLDDLVGAARAFPEQLFVLDHLGTPLLVGADAGRRAEVLAAWRRAMRSVAACPNVVVKVGGLGLELQGRSWLGEAPPSSADLADFWAPEVHWVIDAFGVGRCIFESNFPIDGLLVDYVTIWNALKRLAKPYSPAEQAALVHDNAVAIYCVEQAEVRP